MTTPLTSRSNHGYRYLARATAVLRVLGGPWTRHGQPPRERAPAVQRNANMTAEPQTGRRRFAHLTRTSEGCFSDWLPNGRRRLRGHRVQLASGL